MKNEQFFNKVKSAVSLLEELLEDANNDEEIYKLIHLQAFCYNLEFGIKYRIENFEKTRRKNK